MPAAVLVKFQNFDSSGLREPTGAEEQAVARELAQRLAVDSEALFDRTQGWQCLVVGQSKPVVEVGVVVWTPDPGAADAARVSSVNVTVTVRGGRESTSAVGPKTALPRGADVGSMRFEANQQLSQLVRDLQGRRIRPCEVKAKVRGRRTVTMEGSTIRYDWQGEGPLHLDRQGRVETNLGIKMQVNAALGECTLTATIDIRLGVTGEYRESNLVFTKMESSTVPSSATVTCPETAARSIPLRPWWGGSWMGESEVGLPFEGGSRVELRPQWLVAEGGDGEMTLELEREGTSPTPVAIGPSRR
jgi:hypothetical protein